MIIIYCNNQNTEDRQKVIYALYFILNFLIYCFKTLNSIFIFLGGIWLKKLGIF